MNKKLKYLLRIQQIVADGYGGVLPNGNVVDRRDHPSAIPILKNDYLCVPEPKLKEAQR